MFEVQRVAFRKIVSQWLSQYQYGDCYEGMVNYNLSNYLLNMLHLRGKPYHSEVFSDFSLGSYLSLLLLKRKAFEYEKELRFMLVNSDTHKQKDHVYLDLPIRWQDIIKMIFVDDNCTEEEFLEFSNFCKSNGISGEKVRRLNLYEMNNSITIQH